MSENKRELHGVGGILVKILGALLPVTALVYALRILPEFGVTIYKEQFLAFFLMLCLVLTFMVVPARRGKTETEHAIPWYDLLLIALSLAVGCYISFRYHALVGQLGLITDDKVIASTIGIFLLLEAARRFAGWTMVSIGLIALLYAYFGNHLSGLFETRVIRFDRLMIYNFLGEGSVFGDPLFVAGTIVIAFVLFGQMLFRVGGGQAISDVAFALMGRRRGGPAKVSVVASALFGSMSGSASANVATTGMLTIPMMKRVGYSAERAGAIEAVASTGGLTLPPIMAATGFIMAEFLGIPYASVALAAAIPALLFYLCVYVQVDLEAGRGGITSVPEDQLPPLKPALIAVVPVLVPFAVLMYMLFVVGWSPEASAFMATASTVLISLAVPRMRRKLKDYVEVLAEAGSAVIFIGVMCAVAGLVVGSLGLTGLGTNLSHNLVEIAGGNMWLLLIFAALGCIVLGMGVPVTATYIILVTLIGPALVQSGVNELAAHMFVFYFGTLSFLTPPVCLSVFVAASLANSHPMRTAMQSLRFAVVAYILPFAFVLNGAYLLQGSAADIINTIVGAVAGVFLLSIGLVGYAAGRLSAVSRIISVIAGLGAISLGASSWPLAGLAWLLLAALYLYQRWNERRAAAESGDTSFSAG